MKTVTIYKITVTEAPQMADCDTHYSLEPWGEQTREYKGDDDGGQQYILPEKYSVGLDAAGSPRIYDARDLETPIVGVTHPAVVNEFGLPERLARA